MLILQLTAMSRHPTFTLRSKFWRLAHKPLVANLLRDPWLCRILLGVAVLLVTLSLLSVSFWSCPVLKIFGLPCPGCGMTRSVKFLVTGDFLQSLRYHAFGSLIVVGGVVLLVGGLLPRSLRVPLARKLAPCERAVALHGWLVGALIFYWIFRLSADFVGFISLDHLPH